MADNKDWEEEVQMELDKDDDGQLVEQNQLDKEDNGLLVEQNQLDKEDNWATSRTKPAGQRG